MHETLEILGLATNLNWLAICHIETQSTKAYLYTNTITLRRYAFRNKKFRTEAVSPMESFSLVLQLRAANEMLRLLIGFADCHIGLLKQPCPTYFQFHSRLNKFSCIVFSIFSVNCPLLSVQFPSKGVQSWNCLSKVTTIDYLPETTT